MRERAILRSQRSVVDFRLNATRSVGFDDHHHGSKGEKNIIVPRPFAEATRVVEKPFRSLYNKRSRNLEEVGTPQSTQHTKNSIIMNR